MFSGKPYSLSFPWFYLQIHIANRAFAGLTACNIRVNSTGTYFDCLFASPSINHQLRLAFRTDTCMVADNFSMHRAGISFCHIPHLSFLESVKSMLHFGHLPGSPLTTCGCIGQVYWTITVVGLGLGTFALLFWAKVDNVAKNAINNMKYVFI